LPGIKIVGAELIVVNYFIKSILFFNTLLFLFFVYQGLKNSFIIFFDASKISKLKINLFILLIGLPAIFLFIYDSNQNFYRIFFINTLLCIVIYLKTNFKFLYGRNVLFKAYSYICIFLFMITTVLNYYIFFPQFKSGYEGPSISVFEDYPLIASKINKIASDANIDLSQGYLIVDDLTYPALKKFPNFIFFRYGNITRFNFHKFFIKTCFKTIIT
jgi:hypothetical protein